MSNDYTPTTGQILEIALLGAYYAARDDGHQLDSDEFREMFDRWLRIIKSDAVWDAEEALVQKDVFTERTLEILDSVRAQWDD